MEYLLRNREGNESASADGTDADMLWSGATCAQGYSQESQLRINNTISHRNTFKF